MALGRRIRTFFRGGDLSGSAPNPTVTQARGLRETAGPTTLTIGAVTDGQFLKRDGTTITSAAAGGGGLGDVVGPSSATDNALARFDSTTGKLIQNSTVTLDDTGAITVPEMAAPSTPAASKVVMYAKADGLLYSKDDAGAETALGGGGAGYAGVTTGGTGSLDFAQGTKTADEPFIDGTVSWNSSGITFNGIRIDVTDTASASGSLLLNLKKGGNTIFSVSKNGAVWVLTSGSTILIAQNGSYGFSSGALITSGPSAGASSGTVLFSTTWATTIRNFTAPSGSTNNPDFGANAYLYRITPNAAGSTLTGGRDIVQTTEMHEIANVGSALLTLANNNSGSTAGRRWLTANNLDMQLAPNQKAFYLFDGTSNNHRIGKCETSETLNVTTQFDKVDATLADVTGLSIGVQASRTYNFRAVLFVDADAIGGYKLAIGGTATATSIIYNIKAIDNATSTFTITSRQTALAGSSGAATGTGLLIEIEGTIKVNAAGTLTVQFAQNAANGTSSVLVGSAFMVNNIG